MLICKRLFIFKYLYPHDNVCCVAEFAKVCEQSTDFHFPSLEQQFERIEADISTANEWTAQRKLSEEGDKISVRSGGSSSSEVTSDINGYLINC